MSIQRLQIERFGLISARSFEEVLEGLEKGIGRPDLRELSRRMAEAPSFPEYERLIRGAVGPADLMEFLRLDLGAALRKDPGAKAYRIVRIIAGNPLIMKQMVEEVPAAGSYAPVTILVHEGADGVHLSYDTMASLLAPYGNRRALAVAEALDAKVIGLLTQAAG